MEGEVSHFTGFSGAYKCLRMFLVCTSYISTEMQYRFVNNTNQYTEFYFVIIIVIKDDQLYVERGHLTLSYLGCMRSDLQQWHDHIKPINAFDTHKNFMLDTIKTAVQ